MKIDRIDNNYKPHFGDIIINNQRAAQFIKTLSDKELMHLKMHSTFEKGKKPDILLGISCNYERGFKPINTTLDIQVGSTELEDSPLNFRRAITKAISIAKDYRKKYIQYRQ